MKEILPQLIGQAVGILVTGLVFLCMKPQRKKLMLRLAAELGLQINNGLPRFPKLRWLHWIKKPPFATGLYEGRTTRIGNKKVGKASIMTLEMRLRTKPGLEINIRRNSWWTYSFLSRRMKRVKTGNKAFDKQISIHSNRPQFAAAILSTPEIADAIANTWREHKIAGALVVKDGMISYASGQQKSIEKEVVLFKATAKLCNTLAHATEAATDVLESAGS